MPYDIFAPDKHTDLLGPAEPREQVQGWVAKASTRKFGVRPLAAEMLVLCGPPGSGKTLLAFSALRSAGFQAVGTQVDLPKAKLLAELKQQTTRDFSGLPVALVYDDCPVDEVLKLKVRCPVVVTCLYADRHMLASRPSVVRLRPLPLYPSLKLAARAAAGWGAAVSGAAAGRLTAVAESAAGDMRQVILGACFPNTSTKDASAMPFDLVRDALTGKRSELEGCAYGVACIHENVISLVSTLADLVAFSQNLAEADSLGCSDVVAPLAAHFALLADPLSRTSHFALRAPASVSIERRATQNREKLLALPRMSTKKRSFLQLSTEKF